MLGRNVGDRSEQAIRKLNREVLVDPDAQLLSHPTSVRRGESRPRSERWWRCVHRMRTKHDPTYDGGAGRMVGNFPQAFSHLALVQAAYRLAEA